MQIIHNQSVKQIYMAPCVASEPEALVLYWYCCILSIGHSFFYSCT